MVHCADQTFYVGHSDDLERRIAQHEAGDGAGYTQPRLPIKLVWYESFASRREALEAERKVKGWSKAKKLALIRGDWAMIKSLARNSEAKKGGLRQAQPERSVGSVDD